MLGLVVAVGAASLVTFYLVPRYPGDDYRPLIARTVEQGLPGDTIFAVYPWQVGYWRSYGSGDGPTALLTPDVDWTPGVAAALDAALARGKVWFPRTWRWARSWRSRLRDIWEGAPCCSSTTGMARHPVSGWSVTSQPQAVDAPPVRFALRGTDDAVELIGVDAAASRSPRPTPSSRSPCAGACPRRCPSWG